MIGPLSRDVVDGRERGIGGGPWYAGRALRALGQEAVVVAKCGEPERRSYLRRLASLGLPVSLAAAGETTSFSFRYDAEGHREMRVEAIGEPWSEGDDPDSALRGVDWVHVAPLLRDDFSPERLERIARRRRMLLDGHGLVRARRVGPLELDGDFDRELLRHVSVLKLAEEEAQAILGHGDLEELRGLGVPEVVVTFGAARVARPHKGRGSASRGATGPRRPDGRGGCLLDRLPRRARRRPQADLGRPPRERPRLGPT